MSGGDAQGGASSGLLAKTARGAGWIVGWRMATRALGLVSTLALVRLLAPGDFGLVALATSFAQAIDAFAQIGVEDAVIREKAPTRAMYDTAFTLNLIRYWGTAAVVAAAAVPVAGFFGEPRLADVLLALAIGTCADGLANIGVLDFRRNFTFEREFVLLVIPRLASILIAIGCAWAFRSYWALVAGILSQRVLRILLGYTMHPYRPRLTLCAWRSLVGYSSWTWAISIAMLLRDRSDSFVIGRVLDATRVGMYSVGQEIALLPSSEIVEPLNRACFSGFSEAQRTGAPVAPAYLRIVGTAALLTLPAGIGTSLVAEPLVRLAFGPQWLSAVPVIQVLGAASVLTVFGNIGMVLLGTHARLAVIFRSVLLAGLLRVGLLALLVGRYGLVGGAVGAAAGIAAEQVLLAAAATRRFGIRAVDLVRHVWRPVLATAIMAAIVAAMPARWRDLAAEAPAWGLALPVALGAASYSAALLALWIGAGRPAGAELDALGFAHRLLARAAGSLRAAVAAGAGGSK